MANLNEYPIPEGGVVGKVLPGEAVIVHPLKGKVEVLNEVGARIWSLVDGKHSGNEIAAAIQAEYTVSLEQAQADTLAFLQDLENRALIRFLQSAQ